MLKIEILNVNNINEYSNFINYLKNCSWQSTGEYLAELIENDNEGLITQKLSFKYVKRGSTL